MTWGLAMHCAHSPPLTRWYLRKCVYTGSTDRRRATSARTHGNVHASVGEPLTRPRRHSLVRFGGACACKKRRRECRAPKRTPCASTAQNSSQCVSVDLFVAEEDRGPAPQGVAAAVPIVKCVGRTVSRSAHLYEQCRPVLQYAMQTRV